MAGLIDDNKTYFAKTDFRNQERVFGIKLADRRQHMYIIGKTGTGKTALLKNMAIQDIKNGRGIGIVDPHGEFVEEVLDQVPAERVNDVVYINPADTEHPVAFNVLEIPDPQYKHLVASDLMGIFTKIWANVWSARMEYILNNCILALLDTPGSTLLGIPRILVDKDYRQKIVYNITDPVVKAFWVQEYEAYDPRFRNEAIAPIQNKVGQFLSTSLVRNIVGQAKSTINIPDIMNSGKILLMNVSKGRIGEDNSALLGAMLITKVQLAAMERVRIPEEERKDFYLYVDEFQNFATDSFASILSEARKYRLNLVIAHQYIGQLVTDTSTKVRDAVFGNVGTMITFRVGATDAEFLEKEYEPEFAIQDLVNLPNFHIYLKLMVNQVTSRPFSAITLPPFKAEKTEEARPKIIDASRKLYAHPRTLVEEEINRWSGMRIGGAEREGAAEGAVKYEAKCWSCGKLTQVAFQPDERRPIYCQDCLKKLKAGEIEPIPPRRAAMQRPAGEYPSHLGRLGIEFESKFESKKEGGGRAPAPFRQKEGEEGTFRSRPGQFQTARPRPQFSRKSFPSIREGEFVARSQKEAPQKTISLEELRRARQEEAPPKKKGPIIEELRKALKETLEAKEAETSGTANASAVKVSEGIGEKENKETIRGENNKGNTKGTLRPGESVRFE